MKHRNWLAGACAAFLPVVSQAAAMMMVDRVTGPSKMTNYVGWFFADSASWSIDRAKVAEPHSFSVTVQSSAGAAALLQISASGTSVKRIVLDQLATSDGGSVVMQRLTCEDALIRSSAVHVPPEPRALIELKIQCGRLLWEHFDYSDQKTIIAAGKGSWNFKTNTP